MSENDFECFANTGVKVSMPAKGTSGGVFGGAR